LLACSYTRACACVPLRACVSQGDAAFVQAGFDTIHRGDDLSLFGPMERMRMLFRKRRMGINVK
jgi:hypothetical protein